MLFRDKTKLTNIFTKTKVYLNSEGIHCYQLYIYSSTFYDVCAEKEENVFSIGTMTQCWIQTT